MKLIDIHTHRKYQDETQFIFNFDIRKDLPIEGLFCAGIHPWYLNEISNFHYAKLEGLLGHQQCFALGETGLDRACDIDFELQEKAFEKQIKIANKHNINILIIHCVRAYDDVIKIIKELGFKGTMIFHDYNGNHEITKRLLKLNCYFSYGDKLLKPQTKGHQSLKEIPLTRLFIETDDSAHELRDLYQEMAQLKEVQIADLAAQIEVNMAKLSD